MKVLQNTKPLNELLYDLDDIASQGFDCIQINPIQPLKENKRYPWWLSYQPVDFSIGNWVGSRDDLIRFCHEAEKRNIKVIADVVCNHLAQDKPGSLNPHPNVPEKFKNNPYYWKEKKEVKNWNSRYEVINYCMGLPGLNLNHPEVKNEIFNFLDDLVRCGVGGFRFDAAKSIGLPEEGVHFWDEISRRYCHGDFIVYGEVIFGSTELIDAYSKYIMVLTNEYHGTKHDRIVNFAESHDTFLSDDDLGYTKSRSNEDIAWDYYNRSKYFDNMLCYDRPWSKEASKYAWKLTKHSGVPFVQYKYTKPV